MVPVFREFLERQLVSLAFPANDSFVCMPCFRSLEKLPKLRRSVEDLETKIAENLKHVVGEETRARSKWPEHISSS